MISEKSRSLAGFTLIELIIVIAIISILSSMAIPIYIKYQNKSKVSSFALPITNACAKDIIAYCIDLNPSTPTSIDVSNIDLKNCRTSNVLEYNLSINITGNVVCAEGGNISDGTIIGKINTVSDYKAKCNLNNNAIICTVE